MRAVQEDGSFRRRTSRKKGKGGVWMLRKIYRELKSIRKELQEIKEILKPKHVDIYIGREKMN